jgi:hypothetical protein
MGPANPAFEKHEENQDQTEEESSKSNLFKQNNIYIIQQNMQHVHAGF